MANVEINKDVVNDLALFKLRNIQLEIQEILEKWKTTSIEDFLQQSKNGLLVESENDAIDLKQLIKEELELQN
ncbi:MAG: hypothetical protein HeimC2_31220 [Candidatus Heimdallarchaeota archaeon LC_2]|nr:MAG: hypothetical protein HeimC2_31220 [Candidatus Heimdallarchaeota archaeon LC_2]